MTTPEPTVLTPLTWGQWPDGVQGNGIYVSEYAKRHPEVYDLRITGSQGRTHIIELVLVDTEGVPIDEDGCNCDGDVDDEGRQVFHPCNNPICVRERELEERAMARYFRCRPTVHPDDRHDHYDGGRLIRGRRD